VSCFHRLPKAAIEPGPRQFIYPAIFTTARRAVQFLRHNAKEWNLDPTRFAAPGGSGRGRHGALDRFHKTSRPQGDDPVAGSDAPDVRRRVHAQTAYDRAGSRRTFRQSVHGAQHMAIGRHRLSAVGSPTEKSMRCSKPHAGESQPMETARPINHLTGGGAAVFLH